MTGKRRQEYLSQKGFYQIRLRHLSGHAPPWVGARSWAVSRRTMRGSLGCAINGFPFILTVSKHHGCTTPPRWHSAQLAVLRVISESAASSQKPGRWRSGSAGVAGADLGLIAPRRPVCCLSGLHEGRSGGMLSFSWFGLEGGGG